jgi:hypothetical protein
VGAVWAQITPVYVPGAASWEAEVEYHAFIDSNASWLPGDYFDGSTEFDGHTYSWASVADSSVSYARFGPAVSQERARFSWQFANQVAYQLFIQDPDEAYKVIWDSKKVTSTVSSLTLPAGVLTKWDENYRAVLRVWDSYNREHTPGFPIYSQVILDFVFGRSIDIPGVATLDVANQYPYPFMNVLWTYTGTTPSIFEIYRAASPNGKWHLIDSGEPIDYLQDDGTYLFVDTLAPLRVEQRWKVLPVVSGFTPLVNLQDVGTPAVVAPCLSELDGSDAVFFLNPERSMVHTDTATVYQTVGDAPPVLLTQEARTRLYSGSVKGIFASEVGIDADEQAARFERLTKGAGRTLRLTIVNKQMKVFLVEPTWEPEARNEGVRYVARFGFYEVT